MPNHLHQSVHVYAEALHDKDQLSQYSTIILSPVYCLWFIKTTQY